MHFIITVLVLLALAAMVYGTMWIIKNKIHF